MTKYYVLLLALLFLAPTYYDNAEFTVGRMEFSTVVGSGSIAITSEYFTLILREGRCEVRDAYRFCLTNLTYNPVEFYPRETQFVLDVENICDTRCVALGFACETNARCASDYCVHGVCRNQRTWCGDGVCDSGEVCPQDCPVEGDGLEQETESLQVAEQESPQQSVSEPVSPESFDESADSTQETLLVPEPVIALEQQPVSQPVTRQSVMSTSSDVNWPAAIGVFVVGIVLIFIVLRKHRHATI